MRDDIDVSVCVPVYRAHGEPNVASLARDLPSALGHLRGELVVALNGISSANAAVPEGARTVALGVNRGVAPGWNAAARDAKGRTLVFANDDVALGPRSLALLVEALTSDPGVGVVGPVGTQWNLAKARHDDFVALSGRAPGELVDCDVVAGFLFALSREVFDAIGGFDEFYAPCSFEEVDLCTAVALRAGRRCCAVAGVAYSHEWGISRRARPFARVRFDGRSETLRSIHRRNRRHFLSKWADRL